MRLVNVTNKLTKVYLVIARSEMRQKTVVGPVCKLVETSVAAITLIYDY